MHLTGQNPFCTPSLLRHFLVLLPALLHNGKLYFYSFRLFTNIEMNIFVHLFLPFLTILLLVACQALHNDVDHTAVINKQNYDCISDTGVLSDLSREKRATRGRRRRRRRKRSRCRIRIFSPKCRRTRRKQVRRV